MVRFYRTTQGDNFRMFCKFGRLRTAIPNLPCHKAVLTNGTLFGTNIILIFIIGNDCANSWLRALRAKVITQVFDVYIFICVAMLTLLAYRVYILIQS